jgi:multimeric flavodoxin WrbA
MKILTILGSPKKNGNTAALLKKFEERTRTTHKIERINVADYNLQGCDGCDACLGALNELGCVQGDIMIDILERMLAADLVVYASPVYCWNFPAPMKAIMDRMYCMVKYDNGNPIQYLMQGKPVILLTTCGGGASDNLDLVEEAFRREIDYVQARLLGMHALAECSPERIAGQGDAIVQAMCAELETIPLS